MSTDLHDLIFGSAVLGYVVGGLLVALGVAALVGLVVRDDGGKLPISVADPPPARRSPFDAVQRVDGVSPLPRRNAAASRNPRRPPWLN